MSNDNLPKGEVEIQPCPFCNEKPELILRGNAFTKKRNAEIRCDKCNVEMVVGAVHNSLEWCQDKVIEKWNNRTRPATHAADEGGEDSGNNFLLWVVVNKWEYDVNSHTWFNNYITEFHGLNVSYGKLLKLYRKEPLDSHPSPPASALIQPNPTNNETAKCNRQVDKQYHQPTRTRSYKTYI
jgi:hypothetical protein